MRADKRLYFSFNIAQQSLRQRVDRECIARLGLTSAQAGLLFYVAQNEGCLMKELADGLGIKSAAVTGLVARTEKTGCVRRQVSSDDGRANTLHLTSRGQHKLVQIKQLNESFNERLRAGFSPDEVEVLLRFFDHAVALSRAP